MKQKNRLHSLDIFRGTIIFLMLIIHFYNAFFRVNGAKNLWISLIDFVVFGFLMLIGISVTFHYVEKFKKEGYGKISIYFLKRAFKIFMIYLAYSASIIIVTGKVTPLSLLRTIFLLDLNYDLLILIPISFYITVIPFFIFIIQKKIIRNYYVFVLIGVLSYLISYKINYIGFNSSFRFLKALLFGHMDWVTFPIFQWILPFLVGIFIGNFLKNNKKNLMQKSKILIISGALFLSIFLFMFLFYLNSGITIDIDQYKFPPTIYHLIYSISLCLLFLGLYLRNENKFKTRFNFLKVFGQNSLIAYVSHQIFIKIATLSSSNNFINPYILCIIITSLTYISCKANYKLRLL